MDADEFDNDDFIHDHTPSSPDPQLEILDIKDIPKRPSAPVYIVEYFLGACIALYIVNYILGRITNGNLAQQWFEGSKSFLVNGIIYIKVIF